MRHFFSLIRYPYLIGIACMQFVIRYGFFKSQNTATALADWQFGLLVLATVLIAAGGFVIFDLLNVKSDGKNRKIGNIIPESNRYTIYFVLNVMGVAIGFYLSNLILKPSFASVFILVAATLYVYASGLHKMKVIGNLILATMISCCAIIIGVFDLLPAIHTGNRQMMANLFSILLDYAFFVFAIAFISAIISNLESETTETNQDRNDLPVVFENKNTTKIAFVFSLLLLFILSYYVCIYFFKNNLYLATLFFMVFILAPLLYFAIKIWNATTKTQFQHLGNVLKLIQVFGIISIAIVSFNIQHHA